MPNIFIDAGASGYFAENFGGVLLVSPWVNGPGFSTPILVSGGRGVGTGPNGSNDSMAVVDIPFTANQKGSAKLGFFAGGGDPGIILRGNIVDASCYFFCYNTNTGNFQAYKATDNVTSIGYSLFGSSALISPTSADDFSFEVTGTNFIGRHLGVNILSFTDGSITTGKVGIRAWGNGSLYNFVGTNF